MTKKTKTTPPAKQSDSLELVEPYPNPFKITRKQVKIMEQARVRRKQFLLTSEAAKQEGAELLDVVELAEMTAICERLPSGMTIREYTGLALPLDLASLRKAYETMPKRIPQRIQDAWVTLDIAQQARRHLNDGDFAAACMDLFMLGQDEEARARLWSLRERRIQGRKQQTAQDGQAKADEVRATLQKYMQEDKAAGKETPSGRTARAYKRIAEDHNPDFPDKSSISSIMRWRLAA